MMVDPLASWSTFALAVLSFVAVGISFWGIKKQAESFARSVSADLCLKLVDRFDGVEMRRTRSTAAKALLEKTDLTPADDVFDFFELIGLYVRKDIIDIEVAHSMFFHWLNLYWHAGKSYITKSRERSDDIYCDFERLYQAALKVEMKDAPRSRDINPTETDVEAFLRQEVDE
jgi:hypothetical protein